MPELLHLSAIYPSRPEWQERMAEEGGQEEVTYSRRMCDTTADP